MFSSSVCTEPELPPSSRCADDDALPFPLLLLSSSTLIEPPPDENLLRFPKLLLYREIGAGLGELEADDAMAVSLGREWPEGVLSAA